MKTFAYFVFSVVKQFKFAAQKNPRKNTSQNSQAKADVLRSSKRQSFGSPMMDEAFSLGVGEYSDETKI